MRSVAAATGFGTIYKIKAEMAARDKRWREYKPESAATRGKKSAAAKARRVRERLARAGRAGQGILKVAAAVGLGSGTIQRVKAEMAE